jgi:hypothetical protein
LSFGGLLAEHEGGLAMFGLVERSRLAMYERTLKYAKTDARNSRILYVDALMRSLNMVRQAARMTAQHPGVFQPRSTLVEAFDDIPSACLRDLDALLVRSIKKPRLSQRRQANYQIPTLLSGLIYACLVEETKPKFAARAYAFRVNALRFMEPLLQEGLEIMRGS